MLKSASTEPREYTVTLTSQPQESNGAAGLDNTESTMAIVARLGLQHMKKNSLQLVYSVSPEQERI